MFPPSGTLLEEDAAAKADLLDGSIGELSLFQSTFGYYAQGVVPETAVLPSDWRRRLIPYRSLSPTVFGRGDEAHAKLAVPGWRIAVEEPFLDPVA